MPAGEGVGVCIITQARATTNLAMRCILKICVQSTEIALQISARVTRGKCGQIQYEIKLLFGRLFGVHGFDNTGGRVWEQECG